MIFIDTGAFLGRFVEKDQYHTAAVGYWNELASAAVTCFTSNLVLSETLTSLARRTSYRFAAEQALHLYRSQVLKIMRPTARTDPNAND